MTSTAEDDEARAAAGHGDDPHAAYDVGRLLAFSDGVFAIAITLLVLGIPVPNASPGLAELLRLSPNLIGFALSFVLVGTQWILHHKLLRELGAATPRLLWINLFLLMGICLVPFATSLLVRYGGSPAGAIPYAGLQAAIGLVFVALRLQLAPRGMASRPTLVRSWLPVLAFLGSIPLALLLNVYYAYAVWLAGFAISRTGDSRLAARLAGRLSRWPRSRS